MLLKRVERVFYGVKLDIIESGLLNIKGVKGKTARKLFDAGYDSIPKVATAKPRDLAVKLNIPGDKMV